MFLKLPVIDEWCNIYLVQALTLARVEPNEPSFNLNVFTMSGDQLSLLYQKTFSTEAEARAGREELGRYVSVHTGSDEIKEEQEALEGEDEFDIPEDATIQ